ATHTTPIQATATDASTTREPGYSARASTLSALSGSCAWSCTIGTRPQPSNACSWPKTLPATSTTTQTAPKPTLTSRLGRLPLNSVGSRPLVQRQRDLCAGVHGRCGQLQRRLCGQFEVVRSSAQVNALGAGGIDQRLVGRQFDGIVPHLVNGEDDGAAELVHLKGLAPFGRHRGTRRLGLLLLPTRPV